MKYLQPTFTMPQIKPNPDACCWPCTFPRSTEPHSDWCQKAALSTPEPELATPLEILAILSMTRPKQLKP